MIGTRKGVVRQDGGLMNNVLTSQQNETLGFLISAVHSCLCKLHTVLMIGWVALCPRPGLAQTRYTITDLGTLRGSSGYSQGFGINASGDVTGLSLNQSGLYRGFLYHGGSMTDLGTLGSFLPSVGFGINASRQVTGYSYLSDDTSQNAFLYDSGTIVSLGTLGGSQSFG